jgi:sterol desaturase/sphingolipid hydroxylase (fatty acid hydroxylase superfamily)
MTESSWPDIESRLHFYIPLVAFAGIALWETFAPLRAAILPTGRRWAANASLAIGGNLVVRLAVPAGLIALAAAWESNPLGLFHLAGISGPLRWVSSLLVIDLARYLHHVAYHRVGLLWRIHRVHHSDADFDLMTALRFHPLETLTLVGAYAAAILAFAPAASAVAVYELIYAVQALAGHSNVVLPARLERGLRWVIVTSYMHRIHHSAAQGESERNFGELFSFWDRLFGTYLQDPAAGHAEMRIGLEEMRGPRAMNPLRLLALPFRTAAVADSTGTQGRAHFEP